MDKNECFFMHVQTARFKTKISSQQQSIGAVVHIINKLIVITFYGENIQTHCRVSNVLSQNPRCIYRFGIFQIMDKKLTILASNCAGVHAFLQLVTHLSDSTSKSLWFLSIELGLIIRFSYVCVCVCVCVLSHKERSCVQAGIYADDDNDRK